MAGCPFRGRRRMSSRTGEASEIFGPNAGEVWALVVVKAAKSAAKVRKSRNGRKRPILTRGRKSQGKSIEGCGVDGRGQENPDGITVLVGHAFGWAPCSAPDPHGPRRPPPWPDPRCTWSALLRQRDSCHLIDGHEIPTHGLYRLRIGDL